MTPETAARMAEQHADGYDDPTVQNALRTLAEDIRKRAERDRKLHGLSQKQLDDLQNGRLYRVLGEGNGQDNSADTFVCIRLRDFKRERGYIRKIVSQLT